MTDDENAVRTVVDTWLSAIKAGDGATVLSLMTDDVVFLTPGAEPFGKDVFAAALDKIKHVPVDIRSDIRELRVLGDWAYLQNHIEMTFTPPNGAAPLRRSGHALSILRKNASGQWQLARDANLMPAG